MCLKQRPSPKARHGRIHLRPPGLVADTVSLLFATRVDAPVFTHKRKKKCTQVSGVGCVTLCLVSLAHDCSVPLPMAITRGVLHTSPCLNPLLVTSTPETTDSLQDVLVGVTRNASGQLLETGRRPRSSCAGLHTALSQLRRATLDSVSRCVVALRAALRGV